VIRLGGPVVYRLLKKFFPREADLNSTGRLHLEPYEPRIISIIGRESWDSWKTRTIVDFGCGQGEGSIEIALAGAKRVIGVDIRPELIASARQRALEAGVSDHCEFSMTLPKDSADIIVTIDAFEHFEDPATILSTLSEMLATDGKVVASFGPTWYHPRGGHFFSVFPWSHLLLSELVLCRWRRDFRDDRAACFSEVEGGLNRMTIRRFEQLVANSSLRIDKLCCRPIRATKLIHNQWTREFLTSVTDCVLVKR